MCTEYLNNLKLMRRTHVLYVPTRKMLDIVDADNVAAAAATTTNVPNRSSTLFSHRIV